MNRPVPGEPVKKKDRSPLRERLLLPFITPLVVLILWQVLSDRGILRPTILPSPRAIAGAFGDLAASGQLAQNLEVSLLRVFEGFGIGAGLGILLGLLMGLFPRLERALSLVTGLLRPIPTIAWIPALILWMGIGEASKVTVIAVGTFWAVLLNVISGVKGTDPKFLEVARVLVKGRSTVLTRVILPSALPSLFTGLRVGLAIAWASVVGAELIAASSGIGYLIMYAREVSQPDVMLVGVGVIGLTGLLMDLLLSNLERRLLKWRGGAGEEER
jgi:sulfonate transport system permease protein